MRILLVDPDRASRDDLRTRLEAADLDDLVVEEVTSGAEAVTAVGAERPDLVLAEWRLPDCTGPELLAKLRAVDDVRLGFVTTAGRPGLVAAAREAGALFLVERPVGAQTFRDVVDRVF